MSARPDYSPPGYPNGWFAVAWSSDIREGEVVRARVFDQELVVFRTRTGVPRVLDAYCPHLGAHLAEGGRVVGENVRCPFHGWQFDGDGQCVEIPYCKKIPPKARVQGWTVREVNGMILVWHHAEGKEPFWDVPEMPEFSDPEWTEPRQFVLEVPVHMQEMAENNCDPVHFEFVHGMAQEQQSEVEFGEEGRFFRINTRSVRETPAGNFNVDLERDTWGLGLTTVRLKGFPGAGLLFFSSTSPLDDRNSISRWIFTTTRNMADVAGEDFVAGMTTGVLQDLRIWKNKRFNHDPVLCEADELLVTFRNWTKQFYSPSQTGK
jgi:phenylpropionate dioxygenase-like ring-hydroxylating dioxygenase large terminal subunit